MKKKLIGLGLLIFIAFSLNGQNRFISEFGIGPNYSSAILKYYEHPKFDRSYSIQGRLGVTARLGMKYKIVKKLFVKANVSYNRLNNKYTAIHNATPLDPSYSIIISKIRSNILGVSFGVECFVFDRLSISGFLTYNKNFKRKTDIDFYMEYEKWDTNYMHTYVMTEDIEDEKSASIEIAYYYKKFSFSPGFEYTFTKKRFNPTENSGYRFKFYLLFNYYI